MSTEVNLPLIIWNYAQVRKAEPSDQKEIIQFQNTMAIEAEGLNFRIILLQGE